MRKLLLAGLAIASVTVPAVAGAKMNVSVPNEAALINPALSGTGQALQAGQMLKTSPSNPGGAALGGGMMLGNEPGHTDGPGTAKIDTDARGPVNDIQVGRGTNDTPQSANPVPVR
jgi:hypothetical protein